MRSRFENKMLSVLFSSLMLFTTLTMSNSFIIRLYASYSISVSFTCDLKQQFLTHKLRHSAPKKVSFLGLTLFLFLSVKIAS